MFGGSRPFEVTVPNRKLEQASAPPGTVCMFRRLQTQVAIGPVQTYLDGFVYGVRGRKHVHVSEVWCRHCDVNESATPHPCEL